MQAPPTTTSSPPTHKTTSLTPATTTDGTVYQFKSDIICDTNDCKILYQNYEGDVPNGTTIIKIEGGEYEVINNEMNDDHIMQTTTTNNNNNTNIVQHHQQQEDVVVKYEDKSLDDEEFQSVSHSLEKEDVKYEPQHQQQQEDVVVKYEDQSLDDDSYEEFQSVSHSLEKEDVKYEPQHQQQQQQEVVAKHEDQSLDDSCEEFQFVSHSPEKVQQQQDGVTCQTITHNDKDLNQTITETIAVPAGGTLASSVKQKRKRKTRSVAADEQGEYLEKMSVRGLDIQRYEHVIDGVSYCLVCAKNDIYKTFKNKYSFQRHAYLLHEGDNRKIFACPICNNEYSRPDKMNMHKKNKHGDMTVAESNAGGAGEGTPLENNMNAADTPAPSKKNRTATIKTQREQKPRNT